MTQLEEVKAKIVAADPDSFKSFTSIRPIRLTDVLLTLAHYRRVPHIQITKHGHLYMQVDGNKHHCEWNCLNDSLDRQMDDTIEFLHFLLFE